MSSRLDKLKTLLNRVEERRHMPRLRAVPPALGPAVASNEASFGEPATASRVASLVPERPHKPAPTTPLESAMADLSPTHGLGGAPTPVPAAPGDLVLDEFEAPQKPAAVRSVSALPQPAARAPRAPAPPAAPAADPFAKDPFASSFPPPEAPLEAPRARESVPTPVPAAAPTSIPSAPASGPGAAPVRPASPQLAPAPVPAAMEPPAPLTEASARIVPEKAAAHAPVAKAVTPARSEAPKTFGELLERSLALRVRE